MSVHSSAVIAVGAILPDSCTVGPFCTIGAEVVLGEGCKLISHVVLDGCTRIGAGNTIYPFTSIGIAPQDLKYQGEATETEIGDENTIRECVTVSRGTTKGGGITRIGSGCLIMAYAHIGHDSQVGSHCILANAATLAGPLLAQRTLRTPPVSGIMSPVSGFAAMKSTNSSCSSRLHIFSAWRTNSRVSATAISLVAM